MPLAVQPNALEKGFRLVCCLLSAGASRFNRGDGDIFQNGQVREKIEMLENHAYVLAELIDVRSGRGNQLSLETDFSGGRFLQQVQAAQEGAFTGTGRAYDEELTPFLWGIIKEIVKTAIENGQNLVVEGCYIPFDWKKDFTQACRERIRYVCLIFSENYIQRHYHDILNHENAIERRMESSPVTQEELLRENRDNLEKCRFYGCDYLLIDESYNVEIML